MGEKSHSLCGRPAVTVQKERGFSILELLVAMTIFLIVIGAVYGVLNLAQQSRSVTNQQVQLSKNVRVALNLLGRDTYNAGLGYPVDNTVILPDNRISTLLGIPNDFDTTRDTIPPVIAGNQITLNTFNNTPNTYTDQVTFLFKDTTFNVINDFSKPLAINAPATVNGIDEIIPVLGSNAACQVNDIFLITGNTGSALGLATGLSGSNKVQFANGDVLGFNQTGVALNGITLPASMQRVLMVTYFVTPDGTLTRREYANVPGTPQNWRDEPLVYGVENFQIKYVLDNGTVSDNPSAGVDGIPGTADDVQANLAKVRQVRFTISVKTTELQAVGQTQQVTMTATFSTRNLGYDAS